MLNPTAVNLITLISLKARSTIEQELITAEQQVEVRDSLGAI